MVVLERFPSPRHPSSNELCDGLSIDPDFPLSVGIQSQPKEMHEVVEVNLPNPLSVERYWQDRPSELFGHVFLDEVVVGVIGFGCAFVDDFLDPSAIRMWLCASSLFVVVRLGANVTTVGHIELIRRFCIAE